MTSVSDRIRHHRATRFAVRTLAALVVLQSLPAARAATLNLSNTPLGVAGASVVKPNFMFVLDDSGSMNWSFMPGELGQWDNDQVGLYSARCNHVYYDPDQEYVPPPDPALTYTATGERVTLPDQGATALVDGFKAYTGGPGTVTSLSSFVMDDVRTLPQKSGATLRAAPIAPGAAFYFRWTGTTPEPTPADCKLTFSGAISGKWVREVVPGADYVKFGNWYSYYRTRLNAMKSAAARAMVEAEDGVRIGLVTINPMDASAKVSADKYLEIRTFDAAQKAAWLRKIYSIVAEPGAGTPLREALSRVGRHYGGKTDGINAGMSSDPVEYKCQPNYTLLTTDGFWDGGFGKRLDGQSILQEDAMLPAPASTVPPPPMGDAFKIKIRVEEVASRQTLIDGPAMAADKGASICSTFVGGLGASNGGWGPLPPAVSKTLTFEPYSSGASGGWGVDWSVCTSNFRAEKFPNWLPVRRQSSTQYAGYMLPVGYSSFAGIMDGFKPDADGYPLKGAGYDIRMTPDLVKLLGLPDAAQWKNDTSTTLVEDGYGFLGANTGSFCEPATWAPVYSIDGKLLYCGSTAETDVKKPLDEPKERMRTTVTLDTEGSLSDVAMYYYNNSLRGDTDKKFNGTPDASTLKSLTDTGKHQRMITYTMGFGVNGFVRFDPSYKSQTSGDYADLVRGPGLADPADPAYGKGWLSPSLHHVFESGARIDDLWHAAVNGRGQYYSAADASEVYESIATLLSEINARNSGGTGAGITTLEPTAANNTIYVPSYYYGRWSGDIVMKSVNPVSGILDPIPTVSAALELGKIVRTACDDREIFLMKGKNLAPFTWSSYKCDASGAPAATPRPDGAAAFSGAKAIFDMFRPSVLYPGYKRGGTRPGDADLVNYLRGQKAWEKTAKTGVFRARADAVLGDIVGSQPVAIDAPWYDYGESGYAAWKACMMGKASGTLPAEAASCTYTGTDARPRTLYVGANDGMLHAFDGTTLKEIWAVIPSAMFPKSVGEPGLARVANTAYNLGHRFMVDGTPAAGDVFDGTTWRTILVTGFNAGGNGYFALDVTTPGVAPKPLWELDGAAKPADLAAITADDLGRSFGNPVITKRAGDGKWVAVVTSGYGSASGKGFLFVVDATTGAVLQKIEAGAGTAAAPVNLAKIAAFVEDPMHDNTSRYVYGGDLDGNLWRFDIASSAAAASAVKIASFTVTGGSGSRPQPITTAPELGRVRVAGGDRVMVMVATGKLLESADLADTAQQSVYGIVDDPAAGAPTVADRASLTQCTITPSGATRSSSCVRGTYAQSWFIDLPTGERTILSPQLQLGTLVFAGNQPGADECAGGGSTWLYYVDYTSGAGVTGAPGSRAAHKFTQGMAQGIRLIRLADGQVRAIITTVDGTAESEAIPTAGAATKGRRVSWREVGE